MSSPNPLASISIDTSRALRLPESPPNSAKILERGPTMADSHKDKSHNPDFPRTLGKRRSIDYEPQIPPPRPSPQARQSAVAFDASANADRQSSSVSPSSVVSSYSANEALVESPSKRQASFPPTADLAMGPQPHTIISASTQATRHRFPGGTRLPVHIPQPSKQSLFNKNGRTQLTASQRAAAHAVATPEDLARAEIKESIRSRLEMRIIAKAAMQKQSSESLGIEAASAPIPAPVPAPGSVSTPDSAPDAARISKKPHAFSKSPKPQDAWATPDATPQQTIAQLSQPRPMPSMPVSPPLSSMQSSPYPFHAYPFAGPSFAVPPTSPDGGNGDTAVQPSTSMLSTMAAGPAMVSGPMGLQSIPMMPIPAMSALAPGSIPGIHLIPGIHMMPGIPGMPGMPGMPGVPGIHGIHGMPGMPIMSGMRIIPMLPGISGVPGVPGMPTMYGSLAPMPIPVSLPGMYPSLGPPHSAAVAAPGPAVHPSMQGQHRLHDMSQPSHGPVYSSGSIPGASAHLSSSMLSQSSHASSTAHSSSVAADVPVKSSRDRKRTSAVQETKEHLSKNRSRTKNPLRVTRTADESEAVDDGSDDDAGDQGMSQPLAEDQALSAAADGNLAHGIGAQSPAEADEAGKHNNSMEGSDALGPYDSVDLGDAIEGTNDAGHDDRGSAVDPLAVGGRMTGSHSAAVSNRTAMNCEAAPGSKAVHPSPASIHTEHSKFLHITEKTPSVTELYFTYGHESDVDKGPMSADLLDDKDMLADYGTSLKPREPREPSEPAAATATTEQTGLAPIAGLKENPSHEMLVLPNIRPGSDPDLNLVEGHYKFGSSTSPNTSEAPHDPFRSPTVATTASPTEAFPFRSPEQRREKLSLDVSRWKLTSASPEQTSLPLVSPTAMEQSPTHGGNLWKLLGVHAGESGDPSGIGGILDSPTKALAFFSER